MSTEVNQTTPVIWRTGKKVTLRPHREEDLTVYQRWINDPAINQYLMVTWPMHKLGQREWLEKVSGNDPDNIRVAIWSQEDSPRLIGNTELCLDMSKQSAVTGTLIGFTADHGKGYATEAKMLLLDYAFNWRGMRKVTSPILAANGASQRYAQKCGYRHMATIEQEHFRDGKWIDEVQYVVFRNEWLPLWEKYKKDL